ncbi:MAG: pseudouridine synthase [Saprospiraceae bacterium]
MRLKPEIIFEDEQIVAVAKPPGMLTIPDRHAPELDNVLGFLREKYGEIFTVHRLDKMTSGLLIFAKNAKAHRHLSLQFEHRSVKKFYQALVDGLVGTDEGDIDSPLGPHPTRKDKMIVIKGETIAYPLQGAEALQIPYFVGGGNINRSNASNQSAFGQYRVSFGSR